MTLLKESIRSSSRKTCFASIVVIGCGLVVGLGSISDYESSSFNEINQIYFKASSSDSSSIVFVGTVLIAHVLSCLAWGLVAPAPKEEVCLIQISLCTYFIGLAIWWVFRYSTTSPTIVNFVVDVLGGVSLVILSLAVPLYIATQKRRGVLICVYFFGKNLMLYLPFSFSKKKDSILLKTATSLIILASVLACCLSSNSNESSNSFSHKKSREEPKFRTNLRSVTILCWASISNNCIIFYQAPRLFEYFVTPLSAKTVLLNIALSIVIPLFSMLPSVFVGTISRTALTYLGGVIVLCYASLMACTIYLQDQLESHSLKSAIPLSFWMFQSALSTSIAPIIYLQGIKAQSYRYLTVSVGSFLYWSVRVMLPTISLLPLTLIFGSTGLLCLMFCVLYVAI
ncbi:BA75_04429T0 [Komagataella pastoris]|uniref:BA75_04429T0 n=1 Tax=Komagataella pastoris TaxID=4922 RepID=A0A1B2JHI1_PICPA|nr:BA75_04429T0 [Komagataella pastoris]